MFTKMKSPFLIVFVLFYLSSEAQTPVYFNIVSHNEITDSLKYATNSADFAYIKTQLLELCDTIISKHAKYNMQLDANFILGALNFDDAADSPDDIIEWAHNSPYIDVDGHNHFDPIVNPYNYSDLAKLLDSCGVVMTRKVLGSNWANPTQTWTQYQTPQAGYTYTDYYWQPEILWGMASPGHVNDLDVFGVWKPLSPNSDQLFLQHNPGNALTAIGGGCKNDVSYTLNVQTGDLKLSTQQVVENIKGIVDYIQTLPPGQNDFYTMNMLINFRDIPQIPSFADSIGSIIDGLQDYVDQGKIVWATLGEKYDLWYAEHTDPNDYFNYDCEGVSLDVNDELSAQNLIQIYPNPAHRELHIVLKEQSDVAISVVNLSGTIVYEKTLSGADSYSLDLNLPKGLYFIFVTQDDSLFAEKIILN